MQRFQPLTAALTILCWASFAATAPAQEASPPAEAGTTEIVAFGDSLSAGYGVGPGESFPEQLQAALREKGYSVEVINAGVSGDTTSGGLARLEWSVPTEAELVIVELGANDALRGLSPQIARDNLEKILERLNERGQEVILAGMMAPPNMGPDYAESFNPIYGELAEEYDVTLYPFFLTGVAAKADLNQDDGMHPNAEGIAVIVENILPVVTETLDSMGVEAGRDTGTDEQG